MPFYVRVIEYTQRENAVSNKREEVQISGEQTKKELDLNSSQSMIHQYLSSIDFRPIARNNEKVWK